MSKEKFFAHISKDGREQTVQEHLEGTAALCSDYASAFNSATQGKVAGLAHDIGKYSTAFQNRLRGGKLRVDHSTAGTYECWKKNQPYAAFVVAGHHGGLPDGGGRGDRPDGNTFFSRINRAKCGSIENYSSWTGSISQADIVRFKDQAEAMFFTRMLFSCLVDADFIDTESFMSGHSREITAVNMEDLVTRFHNYIASWFPPKNALNSQRCAILKRCMNAGTSQKKGLFTLTVPTGGGKTAASLAFALEHAHKHKMQRIIYVIPYTSIIEQTAAEFRKFLGDDVILEHHSGMLYDLTEESSPETIRLAKSTENWDMPVIVTTAVQFFESLFADRSSKCRKLHNIAQSVVIFDEAQMLPLPYLRPCVWAIAQLVKQYGTSVILCTATQPALDNILLEFLPEHPAKELIPSDSIDRNIFQRVSFRHEGTLSWQNLAEKMNASTQVLCIVNARKNAQLLFELLNQEGAFHLSTLMIPKHRHAQLDEIRRRLNDSLPCRVVSTSLIEAGVDVDFPAVYREEAGLDSILQAGGRCNREGRKSSSESLVHVFKSESPIPAQFRTTTEVGKSVMAHYTDYSSGDAIQAYFSELLKLKEKNALDEKGLLHLMNDQRTFFPFRTLAERLQLIGNTTRTIYIPIGEGELLVKQLRSGEYTRTLFRNLGQYGVSVYQRHFDALEYAGVLETLEDGSAILLDTSLYSNTTGLCLEPTNMAFLNV